MIEEGRADLVTTQMSLLGQAQGGAGERAVTQFSLETAINTRRIIIVKFPYSDMNNLPPQVPSLQEAPQISTIFQIPLKTRMYSTISVPLETKQLIRRIQRVDQLTVSINLQVQPKSQHLKMKHLNCSEKSPRH